MGVQIGAAPGPVDGALDGALAARRYVVINNYSVPGSQAGSASGVYPRQHLYGVDQLVSAGASAVALEPSLTVPARLARRLRPDRLGFFLDPEMVARALWRTRASDATLYALNAYCLGNASWRPRGSARVVAVVHDALTGDYTKRLARALDGAVCMTPQAAETLHAAGLSVSVVAGWGPDLSFPLYGQAARRDGPFTVGSFGATERDMAVLVRALSKEKVAGVLTLDGAEGLPQGVRTLASVAAERGVTAFDSNSYARPATAWPLVDVFAIPLSRPFNGPVGLTEVNDALALGRPVVMTKTQGLGFDVEAEGLGLWVEPGDDEGWCRALRTLRDDPDRRAEMGARARRFAESSWNNSLFGQKLVGFLSENEL